MSVPFLPGTSGCPWCAHRTGNSACAACRNGWGPQSDPAWLAKRRHRAGQPDRQQCCGRRQDGGRCGREAAPGQIVCKATHGGAAPQNQAAAGRRIVEGKLAKVLEQRGSRPVENPLEELARIAGDLSAWFDELRDRVDVTDLTGAELAVWGVWCDRITKLLTDLLRLDIDGRLARVKEAQVDALIRAVDAGLFDAGIDPTQVEAAKRAIGRHLRPVIAS